MAGTASVSPSAGRLGALDMQDLPSQDAADRQEGSALAVSPSYSDLSLDEKLRKIGRPLKPLPRRASNGRSPVIDRRPSLDGHEAPSASEDPSSAGRTAHHMHRRQMSNPADGDAADLSGNSHASPATPPHISAFYQGSPFGKKGLTATTTEDLVDQLSEAVLRADLRDAERSHRAAEATERASKAAGADPSAFKFTDLPVSIMNQGFFYRQRMAQIVLSCADEAKAAHFALMSRYYMKPFEHVAAPPAPASPGAGRVKDGPRSAASADECVGDESDAGEDSGAEFAWLENTANKKKRKSARSSGNPADVALPAAGTKVPSAAAYTTPARVEDAQRAREPNAAAGDTFAAPPRLSGEDTNGDVGSLWPRPGSGIAMDTQRFGNARPDQMAAFRDAVAQVALSSRLMPPRSRIPYSSRSKATQRERLRAYFRRVRARRSRLREEEEAAREAEARELAEEAERQARLAAEKKPQKRPTKAERKAQARRGGFGASKPMSIAAIKAARNDSNAPSSSRQQQSQPLREEHHGDAEDITRSGSVENVVQGSAQVEKGAHGQRRKAESEDEVEFMLGSEAEAAGVLTSNVEAPRGSFDFVVRSPIADSLEALRASMSAVSLQINNSLGQLGPLDDSFADVMDKAAREGSAELPRHLRSGPDAILPAPPAPRSNMPPLRAATPSTVTPTGQRSIGTASPSPARGNAGAVSRQPAPASTLSARGQPAPPPSAAPSAAVCTNAAPTTAPPPLHSPPPKLTRRKKATMNNVHHRANYVPSRMPSDGPRHSKSTGDKEQPPGLDHPSTTCGLFDGEWMCVFCEYELLYGEPPLMFRACRSRKKIVANRKRAQARARRAAEGGSTAAGSGGGSHQHHHHGHSHHTQHSHSSHHDHHHGQHSDHVHDGYDTPKKKGSSGRTSTRTSRPAQSAQRERCSCGNSIHDSDEGSSAYTHSAPGSPMAERSRSAHRDVDRHYGGHDGVGTSTSPEHLSHYADASPDHATGAVGGSSRAANGKAKALPPAPAPELDPNDYASIFAAMTKDKASQAAIARYIASGGKTSPPPLMMPSH